MGGAYFSSTTLTDIDDLLTIIDTNLTSKGWTKTVLNGSTSAPSAGSIGRETLYKVNGTSASPTRAYVFLNRNQASAGGTQRVQAMACQAITAPIAISTIARSGTTVTVTTGSNHGFSNGDQVAISGTTSGTLNEGNPSGTESAPTTITVTGLASFTYTSASSGTASGTGGFATRVFNPASSRTVFATIGSQMTLSDSAMSVFGYVDEFRCSMLVQQSANDFVYSFGVAGRDHIPAQNSDTAFATTSLSAGVGVTINLDRPSSNIQNGQPIWLMDAVTGLFERTTVSAKNSTTQIVATLANSYSSSALVGEDPGCAYVFGRIGTNSSTGDADTYASRFTHFQNATRTDPVAQTYTVIADGNDGNATSAAPSSDGYYPGRPIIHLRTSSPVGWRGALIGVIAIPKGTQNDQDIAHTGAVSPTNDYKMFAGQVLNTNWLMAIGPFATP